MKNGILTALAWCGIMACGAQDTPDSVYDLFRHHKVLEVASSATLGQRAAVFPSLEIMPKDVDSFFVLTHLYECTDLLAAQNKSLPLDMVMGDFRLDSFATGCNAAAAKDLARLVKIVKLIEGAEGELVDEWVDAATPEAARAVVAQRRALQRARGEQLVELTRDFHQAPLHFVLSCMPGGETVLKQLSVLLMMIPVEVDGPLGLLMQGSKRGFYINCSEVDLSGMALLPEHEQQIRQNLQNKRLYLMSEVQGRHLVISLCSDINAVRLPASPAESMLAADTMTAYDDMLCRNTYAVAHSSKELVNAGREVNMMEYTTAVHFLLDVFKTLAPDNAVIASAASALERLHQQVVKWQPAKLIGDSLRIWKEEDWFIQFEEDASGLSFAPGYLGTRKCSTSENAIFFAESAPLLGPHVPCWDTVLQDAQLVHDGVLATLKPETAAQIRKEEQVPRWVCTLYDSCSQVLQCVSPLLAGEGVILLRETGNAAEPTQIFLCADTVPNDSTHASSWQAVSQAFAALPEETRRGWSLNPDSCALVFSSAPCVPAELYSQRGENPTPGGAVFAFNLQALARASVLMASAAKTQEARDNAKSMLQLAQWIERIEGACSILDNRLLYTFRIKPAK